MVANMSDRQEVVMQLREALRTQSPSLTLQRAAADEVARLDALVAELTRKHYEAQATLAAINQHCVAVLEKYNEFTDDERCDPPYEEALEAVDRIHLALNGG